MDNQNLSFETSIFIAASRDRVWQAITEPKQLEQWFVPGSPWEMPALEVGAPVKFYFGGTDVQDGVIEVVDALTQFRLRWQPHESHPETTMVTTFSLVDENNGTRITVHEAAYKAVPDELRHEQVKLEDNGTEIIAANLKAFVEGVPLPYPATG
jgi:uncharacterized protein YndB with AHSA1/START domain